MTKCYENTKPGKMKMKKDVKWYTYVDAYLDAKLKDYMEEYKIKNQSKLLRNFVNYGIDYFNAMFQKKLNKDPQSYDEAELDKLVREAIETYQMGNGFHEELRQKISPLKMALLLLNNELEDSGKLSEGIQTAISALEELETSVERHFEEPKIIRYIKKIDILYVEDNELERKTIDNYYKSQGINIKSMETSDEALHTLKTLTPRAILLDIDLKTSNINGDKLCQMLKSNPQFDSIPIILISAVFSEKEKQEILAKTMADEIIFKPIDKLKELDVLFKYLKH
jgi:CheY-like chemotaxis protein